MGIATALRARARYPCHPVYADPGLSYPLLSHPVRWPSRSTMHLLLRNFPAAFAGRGRRGFHGQVHARAKHQLYVRAVRLHGSIHQLQLAEHPSAAASGTTCERKEGEATACSPIGNPYLTDATAANFFHWSFHSLSAPLWTQTNKVAASGTRSQEPCLTYIWSVFLFSPLCNGIPTHTHGI